MVLLYVRVYWGVSDIGEYSEDNGLCECCQFDINWIMWKNNALHLMCIYDICVYMIYVYIWYMCIYDIGEYTECNGMCECCQFDDDNVISIGYCGRIMHSTLYIRNLTTTIRWVDFIHTTTFKKSNDYNHTKSNDCNPLSGCVNREVIFRFKMRVEPMDLICFITLC